MTAFADSACTNKRELGNVLRTGIREKYKTLDPAHASDFYSHILSRRAYEGLVQYHYLKRPYALEPLLAESMPEVSKDGLTYTFRLKKGVYFQDDPAFGQGGKGREVVAEDFIYSFRRLADPRESSDGWWIFDGKIAGLNEWAEQAKRSGRADYGAPITGLVTPEKHTLIIKLTRPNPLILHVLTMPYANVVPHEAVERYGAEFGQHAVGTGPFRLDTLTPNQAIWLRNPSFHGQNYPTEGSPGDKEAGRLADAGKPLPFVDKIIDDIIIEDQPAWLNFMQNNHDYLSKVNKDNAGDIFDLNHKARQTISEQGIEVFTTPGIWFNYVAFNMEDPVVGGEKNKFLRKAMALALDEGPMIEKFYLGLATRAETPIPPGIGGYEPSYRNPSREYNLVQAREILAKAGHANGQGIPELVYDLKSDMTYRQIGEYFQRSMAELGIRVSLNTVSWPELLSRVRRKQAQIWGITWQYDYPDAENGWQLLYSKNESPGSNESNYKNPKFDALYEKIALMRDSPERFALFAKMRDIFAQDVPWIITVNQAETRLTHYWLHNFKIHQFEHNVEKYLRVDVATRAKALR
ncbi:MAG: hypothetical protein HY074_02660 [Deltaproteobacteria bacterium]|nr:hypothetical protein [Deltaproteobacteria bacterium]